MATEIRTPTGVDHPLPNGVLSRRGLVAFVAAMLSVLVARALMGQLAPAAVAGDPLAYPSIFLVVTGATVVATLVYAAIDRYTDEPARYFVGVGLLVLALSFAPIVLTAPALGVTSDGQLLLAILHIIAAVAIMGPLAYEP
ncbi:DUF6069 family protein [Natronomonas sp. EA1]|uniref:DUF6069 family protein n=1 Tax=Natronomonas sp. EA1 TaxID=3421655 RepID=UPI003EBB1FF8